MLDKQCVVAPYELEQALELLPDVEQWDETTVPPFDIFITVLGFEDRSIHIAEALASAVHSGRAAQASLALVARYETNSTDNVRNEPALRKALSTLTKRIEYVNGDLPQSIACEIGTHIDALCVDGAYVKVIFDISGASGNLILSAMHALLERNESIDLTVFYSEPERYYPSREEYDRDTEGLVLSCCAVGDPNSPHEYGVEVVQVNELYPGYGVENRPELIIAIPSFRTERLRYCLQYVSDQIQAAPDRYVRWLLGYPPAESNRWRYDLQHRVINRMMASMVGLDPSDTEAPTLSNENCHPVSTLNYREMTETIIKSADSNPGNKLSVIHMGSKMQAIGLSLALHVRSEISVCYARPTGFNVARYSSGCSTTWVVRFGQLKPKVDELGRVGELRLMTTIETDRTGLQALE